MLFPSTFAFEPTVSNQEGATDHDGVFAVAEADVAAYVERFDPQPLRDRVTTASEVDLPFRNFGKVKGLNFDRVLLYPTSTITKFLTNGTALPLKNACRIYVDVTHPRPSVPFGVTTPSQSGLAHCMLDTLILRAT